MRSANFASLKVGLLSYRIVGWVCVLLFSSASVAAYAANQRGPAWGFVVFVVLGLYVLLSAGTFELNDDYVAHENAFGRYRIAWNEVRAIEVGTSGTIVLHGNNKRFLLLPPSAWSGNDKPAAVLLFVGKLDSLGLVPYLSKVGDFKVNKNVRVD